MSKSLGNVFTVRDMLDKGYRASALRYLLISVHYRKQLMFNWDVLAQADAAVTRLADFVARVDGRVPMLGDRIRRSRRGSREARAGFRELIAQDLNVPGALGVIFELVREMNAAMDHGEVGAADAAPHSRDDGRVRSRDRRARPAPRGGRPAAGAAGGDRAAHRRCGARRVTPATSRAPTRFAASSTPGASSSRIPPPAPAGSASDKSIEQLGN